MGKVKNFLDKPTFTSIQKLIFDKFSEDKSLRKQFYFTGGTALSAFYLHHRESEDLDFFSESDFVNQITDRFTNQISKTINTESRFTQIENTRIYELLKDGKLQMKIDFNYYPYQRLKQGITFQDVAIDSLFDIATNKLQTIISRTQIKDFVDLFFLLKEFTFWDLVHAVKQKFNLEEDLVLLGSNFLKVEQFDVLPKMLIPLTLNELQDFFKEQAKKIAKRVIEK